MIEILKQAVIDSANEVAGWKLRAYIAEARVAELTQAEEEEADA